MVYAERTTWSAAELLTLPDDGYHYELVKGRLIQMAPTTADHGETSAVLGTELGLYARMHGGHSYAAETGFNLTRPGEAEETVLGPDAAYIRDEIVPKGIATASSGVRPTSRLRSLRRRSSAPRWRAKCACGWHAGAAWSG